MTNASTSGPAEEPAAVAAYVAAMTAELSRIARANGLTTLAYILEMARLEAKAVSDGAGGGKGGETGG